MSTQGNKQIHSYSSRGMLQVHPHGCPPALVRGAAGHQLRARLPPAVPPPAGQRDGAAGDHDQVQRVTRVTCNVSHVTCHMSHVTCHVSHVTCHNTGSTGST